jgi:hypothetical protein
MKNRGIVVVWITECFLVAWGLWMAIKGARGIWRAFAGLYTYSNVDADYLWFVVSSILFFVLLPGLALASAYGLFKRRSWGRISALVICLLLLGLGLYAAVVLAVVHFQYSTVPPAPIPESAVVVDVNYWPTYLSGLLAGVLAFLLLQNFVKRTLAK